MRGIYLVEVIQMKQETEKVKCPTCHTEVIEGNFCEQCGVKLKKVVIVGY